MLDGASAEEKAAATREIPAPVVKVVGGIRRFMALGDHFEHLPAGTELKYGGHVFRLGDDGALELIALSRFKPIWGHGEAFNAQNWHRYQYNEIYLANGKRLDSYSPGDWIVERKYRQYAALKDPVQLAGKNVLEIPPQNGPLNVDALRDAMNGRPPVVIRDHRTGRATWPNASSLRTGTTGPGRPRPA